MKTVLKLLFVIAFCYNASAQDGSKQACDSKQSYQSQIKLNATTVCASAPTQADARTIATSICKQKIEQDNGDVIKATAGDTFGCRGCLNGETGCEMSISSLTKVIGSNNYRATGNPVGVPDSTNPDNKIYCFKCPGGEWEAKFKCADCVDTTIHNDVILKFKYNNRGEIVNLDGTPLGSSVIAGLYPNPTNGIINVSFLALQDYEALDIIISDMRGRAVWQSSSEALFKGENTISISTYNLASGPHLLSLFYNGVRLDTHSVSILE